MSDSEPARIYHRKEYEGLRSEFLEMVKFAEKLLPATILFSTGVYAWMITERKEGSLLINPTIWNLILVLPTMSTIIAIILSFATQMKTISIGSYLRRLEDALGDSKLGWEKHINQQRLLRHIRVGSTTVTGISHQILAALLTWGILLIVNIAAVWFMRS